MELRRAILLFAIVLGLAAIVTSFSSPAQRNDEGASDPAAIRPGPARAGPRRTAPRPPLLSFSAAERPRTRQLASGQAATVRVESRRPGEVELPGLGLSGATDRLTPARFDVLETRPGRYPVRFTPAGGGEPRTIGALRIVR